MEQKRNNHLVSSPDFYSRIEIKEIYKYSEERDILNYVRRFFSLFLSFDHLLFFLTIVVTRLYLPLQ